MAAKPAKLPRWATAPDVGDLVEPSESGATGSKDKGWKAGYKPPAPWINWLFNNIYSWCVYVDDLTNTAMTWIETHVFQKGITVTNSTTNGSAITATGNGTGSGGTFTGGSNGGAGITCIGGAINGKGIIATGNGTGSAVYATSGTGGGYAIQALPSIGSGGQGLFASADGAGVAITAISGANGAAIFAQAGGGNKPGIRSSGNGTGAAVQCEQGGVLFLSAAEPAAGADPGADRAYAASQAKDWTDIIFDGAGGVTFPNNYAISNVTYIGFTITVTFAHAFANTNYVVLMTGADGANRNWVVTAKSKTFTTCAIQALDPTTGSPFNPATVALRVSLGVFGRH